MRAVCWGTPVEHGLRGDAVAGVQAAELPEPGSGFGVCLVHIRSETSHRGFRQKFDGVRRGKAGLIRRRYVEKRMLSQRECERPVTERTGIREQGPGIRRLGTGREVRESVKKGQGAW